MMKVQAVSVELDLYDLFRDGGDEILDVFDDWDLENAIEEVIVRTIDKDWPSRLLKVLSPSTSESDRWTVTWGRDIYDHETHRILKFCRTKTAVKRALPKWVKEVFIVLEHSTLTLGTK